MKIWLWVFVVFAHFVNVTPLPTHREKQLDENRALYDRSSLRSRVLTESIPASILPQDNDKSNRELVEYSQKSLEDLKILATANSVQSGRHCNCHGC